MTQSQADKLCKNGEHFFSAMQQNNYFLPKAGWKSPFCTVKFFMDVVQSITWLPKVPRIKRCLHPPPISELVEIISDFILTIDAEGQEERKACYVRFLCHLRKKTPDQDYLVQIVGILDPTHPMFKPGFKSQKEKAKEEEKKLDGMNQEFWDNVEELPLSEMRKRGTVCFGKKKDHLQESLESMIRKKESITSRFDEAIASKQKKI